MMRYCNVKVIEYMMHRRVRSLAWGPIPDITPSKSIIKSSNTRHMQRLTDKCAFPCRKMALIAFNIYLWKVLAQQWYYVRMISRILPSGLSALKKNAFFSVIGIRRSLEDIIQTLHFSLLMKDVIFYPKLSWFSMFLSVWENEMEKWV